SVLVIEVIIDALVLHQAADEIEIGLAILHAVLPRMMRARKLVGYLSAIDTQHFLDDVGHRLVVEDAAVGAASREPQPWAQGRAVGVSVTRGKRSALLLGRLAKAGDVGVQVARRAVILGFEHQGHVRAEEVLGLDRGALAQELEVVLEQAPQLFLARNARKQQDIGPQLGIDLRKAMFSRCGVHPTNPYRASRTRAWRGNWSGVPISRTGMRTLPDLPVRALC